MVESLELTNFKCFEEQTIPLSQLTVLSGLNSAGKSTVIQSLILLRQSHLQNLLPAIGLSLNGDLFRLGTARDALFEGAATDEIAIAARVDGVVSKWRFSYGRPEENVIPVKSVSSADRINGLFDDNFCYLQAERMGPRTSFPVSDFQVRQHRQLGPQGEFTIHYLYEFGSEPVDARLHHPTAASETLKNEVEAWMGEVSPGVRLELTSHPGIDVVAPGVQFVEGLLLSRTFRATSVGFGIFYSLPVVTALLSRTPGALVLIENPEAHLHPRGQVKMGELLARAASTGIQILIETHSDHILNGLRLAVRDAVIAPEQVTLHFFERHMGSGQPKTRTTALKIDRNGRLDKWPPGFFDEWDKSLEALLEPSGQ